MESELDAGEMNLTREAQGSWVGDGTGGRKGEEDV